MAEVKIEITAEDRTSPALNTLKNNIQQILNDLKPPEASVFITPALLRYARLIFDIISGVVTIVNITEALNQNTQLHEVAGSITSLKDDISEVKGKLEELNATWSDIYEETAGKYKGRLEGLIEEINFLTNYIADLQETFKDAEFEVDLSGLKRELNEAIKELEGLLGVSLPKVTQGAADAVEESVGSLKNQFSGLDSLLDKTLSLTIAQAIRNTGEVKTALALNAVKESTARLSCRVRSVVRFIFSGSCGSKFALQAGGIK